MNPKRLTRYVLVASLAGSLASSAACSSTTDTTVDASTDAGGDAAVPCRTGAWRCSGGNPSVCDCVTTCQSDNDCSAPMRCLPAQDSFIKSCRIDGQSSRDAASGSDAADARD